MLLLTFRAAEGLYAVDVTRVVEVVPRVQLRRLPHAPDYLAGLFDCRGWVVPVIDLGVLLGAEACRDRLSTRIILVDLQPGDQRQGHRTAAGPHETPKADAAAGERQAPLPRQFVGLIAEQVSDVASVKPEQVISAAIHLPRAPYLGAIVEIDQQMTQMLVVDHLLERSFREAFFEGNGVVEERSESGADAQGEAP